MDRDTTVFSASPFTTDPPSLHLPLLPPPRTPWRSFSATSRFLCSATPPHYPSTLESWYSDIAPRRRAVPMSLSRRLYRRINRHRPLTIRTSANFLPRRRRLAPSVRLLAIRYVRVTIYRSRCISRRYLIANFLNCYIKKQKLQRLSSRS